VVRQSIIAAFLAVSVAGFAQQSTLPDSPQQQGVPDAPRPQTSLPNYGTIAPGSGTGPAIPQSTAPVPAPSADTFQNQAPGTSLGSGSPAPTSADDGPTPDLPAPGQGQGAITTFSTRTNFVEIPFTVKDSHNQLVPGITWREVRVYENNLRQRMAVYTTDAAPLSVALVIDQSVTFDEMTKINNSLAALQGAFTPYDEVAVFTYNNGPRMRTDFTAAQSPRLSAVLEQSKSVGREPMFYDTGTALGNNINLNNGAQMNQMPLTNSNHGTTQSNTINVPRDVHTLNDAILEAAKTVTHAGKGRRRIIYVISDGKEYGSTAKTRDVIRYLQTNKIAVYATLVHGLPTIKGEGFLDKIHLPLQMRDNLLPVYTSATGGQTDPEFRQRGIESSFAKIAELVRNQYTIGYYSHEPFVDGKFRKVEVKVLRPNLTVVAKEGYYPTAVDSTPHAATQTSAQ
jgi:VWFA-related protein